MSPEDLIWLSPYGKRIQQPLMIAFLSIRRWGWRLIEPSPQELGAEILRKPRRWKLLGRLEDVELLGGDCWMFESKDPRSRWKFYCLRESFETNVLVAAFQHG